MILQSGDDLRVAFGEESGQRDRANMRAVRPLLADPKALVVTPQDVDDIGPFIELEQGKLHHALRQAYGRSRPLAIGVKGSKIQIETLPGYIPLRHVEPNSGLFGNLLGVATCEVSDDRQRTIPWRNPCGREAFGQRIASADQRPTGHPSAEH